MRLNPILLPAFEDMDDLTVWLGDCEESAT